MIEPVRLEGIVQRFAGNGRKLGYPTANIDIACDLDDGIYFGFADLDEYKNHPSLIFIGTPVTMGDKVRRVEAHLLDIPDIDHYDQKITLHVKHFWRPNKKLSSVDELIEVIKNDDVAAHEWFGLNRGKGRGYRV